MQDYGYTFLEALLVLSLIALLAVLAVPQYQGLLARHQQQTDIQQLLGMLQFARQQALLLGTNVSITPYQNNDWSEGFLAFKGEVYDDDAQRLTHYETHSKARILLKTFPIGSEYVLSFAGNGYTQTQNGSFYYCPLDLNAAQRIVFNQAGRAYVTADEAMDGCKHH